MNLIEIISRYQKEVADKSILVEYELFFKNIIEKNCKFVLDDIVQLEKLNNVILKIKEKDIDSEIYVNTYGIDFMDEEVCIYADTLWINTVIDLEEILGFFKYFQDIEPSDIILLSEPEMIDGMVELVVLTDCEVENYESFIKKRELSKIKSLYWD